MLVARARRAPAGVDLGASTRGGSGACCRRSPSCSSSSRRSALFVSPFGVAADGGQTGVAALALRGQLVSRHLGTRLLRPQRRARPAAAHLVARGRGAVLPRLPRAAAPRPGGSRRPAGARRARRARHGCSFCSRSALVARPTGRRRRAPERFAFYASPTRAWEFGAGALARARRAAARPLPLGARRRRSARRAWPASGSAAARPRRTRRVPAARRLLPVLGACALHLARDRGVASLVARGSRPPAPCLDRRPLLQLVPLALAADRLRPGALARLAGVPPSPPRPVSLLPAWLSYRYVETPIRHEPRRSGKLVWPWGRLRRLAVPASAGLALRRAASPRARRFGAGGRSTVHADVLGGCNE